MYEKYIIENHKNVVLKDIRKNGKQTDWKNKKITAGYLADSYKRLGYINKALRVDECGNHLEFKLTTNDLLKLYRANFCKVRLCPMCSWRRSLKIFGQVSQVMNKVEEDFNFKYIFLTLTVENCKGEDLKSTLDLMTKSFNKLSERKQFKKAIKGYFRSLEITYNQKEDTYHPHFHLILAVKDYYFTKSEYYISQKRWTELWKSCLKVDYSPIVDVRRLKKNNKKEIAEVAKYTVKSSDYLIKDEFGNIKESATDGVVSILDNALKNKRLISFGFIFKAIHKRLNLDDAEDGDLIKTSDDLREDLTDIILRYQWNIGIKNYALVEVGKENKNE